jgi:hypothetical protein
VAPGRETSQGISRGRPVPGALAGEIRPQTARPGPRTSPNGPTISEAEPEAEAETTNRIPSQSPSRTEPRGYRSVADARTQSAHTRSSSGAAFVMGASWVSYAARFHSLSAPEVNPETSRWTRRASHLRSNSERNSRPATGSERAQRMYQRS